MKALVLVLLVVGVGLSAAAAQDAAPAPSTGATTGTKPAKAAAAPGAERRRTRAPAPTPDIPEQFAPPQEAYAAFPDQPGGAGQPAAAKPSACQLRLTKLATFKALPTLVGAGECGASDAVLLESITLSDQSKVAVSPAATLRCTMAEQLAAWVREEVAPAALKLGSPLRILDNFDSYECRGRNRVRGATLSEHGRANALDIRALKLANGTSIGLTNVAIAKAWREGVRASACARFSTVLGPGSDGMHEDHIHVDLAERRSGYKTCEWVVREPDKTEEPAAATAQADGALPDPVPLPRPRPLAAQPPPDARLPAAKQPAQVKPQL